VGSIQNKLNKFKNIKRDLLSKKLSVWYENYSENEHLILQTERELDAINDLELSCILDEKKIFENLNFERPSKAFLDIARNCGKGDNLTTIKDENGLDFDSEHDRDNFITNFYADLYRKDQGIEGTIEDFLGPDITNNHLVRNSKLTENEKLTLEADLSISELKKALDESNLKSAPGIDGFSNKFIQKFWNVLSRPLFNVCKKSLSDGTLIDTFATAQIQLIPKKGDTSRIKNWRPISLLSNFYKILSRAIKNRLKTVVNWVLSRAQKGVYEIKANTGGNFKCK
jgi:Reverse transcriptase (RNA-dependent DNA polymerase)